MKNAHALRKPKSAGEAHARRRIVLVLGVVFSAGITLALIALMAGCSAGGNTTPPAPPVIPSPPPALSAADVQNIVQAAAEAADPATMVIAVVDRGGNVLAVYRKPAAPTTSTGNFGAAIDSNDLAVGLARTAAYFSNNQAPLSSRTVRFISGIHFPPGVSNAANAALYGIENTNRGCTLSTNYLPGKAITRSLALGGGFGPGVITGKADLNDSDPNAVNPGGVPIFKGNVLVGGVGIAGVPADVAEFSAFAAAASSGFSPIPQPLPSPGVVFLDGIALPFVMQQTRPAGVNAGTFSGSFVAGPTASAGPPADGDLIAPAAGPAGGLTAAEVKQILDNAEATASKTRAVIRLPLGSRVRMVLAVADLDGTIIGLRRMPDATVFSIDVAASKARNMVYFNSASRTAADLTDVPIGTAVTNRTISFGAQPLYPPGIDGSSAGPFFNLYTLDTANPCTQGLQAGAPDANKSGIVFFPGSSGIFRNGVLVGGLGISGDGVEQDDFVTSGGLAGFEAPANIRADQITVRDVKLPYFKFPRNPTD